MMWLLSSVLSDDDGAPLAHSAQAGRARQAVLGAGQRVGDEPRFMVDFNPGQPLVSTAGRAVGDRTRGTITVSGRTYRVRRQWWRSGLSVDMSRDGSPVLVLRERSRPDSTVHEFDVRWSPDLDPVVTLTLMVLVARPHKMGILNELLR